MICMISKVKVRLGEMIFMSCDSHVSLKLPFFGVKKPEFIESRQFDELP